MMENVLFVESAAEKLPGPAGRVYCFAADFETSVTAAIDGTDPIPAARFQALGYFTKKSFLSALHINL